VLALFRKGEATGAAATCKAATAPATRFPWEIYGCLDCRQHLRRKTPAPEGRVQVPTVMLFGTLCTA